MIQTALWLDAADASTVYDATSGGNLVSNGGAIARWNDKSGNGRNITQATSGNRPVFNTNALNGLSLVNCGSDDFLSSTATHNIGTTSVIAAVFRPNTLATSDNLDFVTGGTAGNNLDTHILYRKGDTPVSLNLFSGNVLTGTNPLVVNTPSLAIGVTNGSSSSIRHNGSVIASGNAGAQAWNSGVLIGKSAATTSYVNAAYAEVVLISGPSTQNNIEKIEGYLAWKWGLTANLPAGHPYKTIGPRP
jgi:hypothetical protein